MDLDEAFGKLSEFNIKDHCHVNTNEDGDRFVGIKADTNDAMVYFPIGYQLPDEDKAIRNDIRHLIQVLSEFTTRDDRLLAVNKFAAPQSVDFPINAYTSVIEYYFDIGGKYKTADNIIEEEDAAGIKYIRFKPVAAWETPTAIEELCRSFEEALATEQIDPLILIPMFVLDFLCIHPFNDGNGRMSRLLTLLLLYRSGYIVGKYISMEKLIESTKENYYDCLQKSSVKWHENENNYEPFVKYMLGIVAAAYREFSSRVSILTTTDLSKPDRVKALIKTTLGTVTKAEILEKCPDISQVTVQRALADLVESGEIIKIGGGRYTRYTWNNNRQES